MIVLSIVLSLILCAVTTLVVIKNADLLQLMQEENARSSHKGSKPSGGGMGIVFGATAGLVLVPDTDPVLISVFSLAFFVAIIGLADDRWQISARIRVIHQIGVIGITTLVILNAQNYFADWSLVSTFLVAFVIFSGVWWVNLYNFMDGIDGYAAVQAIFMLGAGVIIYIAQHRHPLDSSWIFVALILLSAVFGFLIFNWPPAHVFMGNIGSAYLGYLLFALMFYAIEMETIGVWQWLILGVVFVSDATVAILMRLLRREKIWRAHNSHAYQRLSRYFGSHRPVTFLLVCVNVLIVFPAAWLAGQATDMAPVLALFIYALAGAVALILGAGIPGNLPSSRDQMKIKGE